MDNKMAQQLMLERFKIWMGYALNVSIVVLAIPMVFLLRHMNETGLWQVRTSHFYNFLATYTLLPLAWHLFLPVNFTFDMMCHSYKNTQQKGHKLAILIGLTVVLSILFLISLFTGHSVFSLAVIVVITILFGALLTGWISYFYFPLMFWFIGVSIPMTDYNFSSIRYERPGFFVSGAWMLIPEICLALSILIVLQKKKALKKAVKLQDLIPLKTMREEHLAGSIVDKDETPALEDYTNTNAIIAGLVYLDKHHLRPAEKAAAKASDSQTAAKQDEAPASDDKLIRLGHVAIPERVEPQNFMLVGSVGSGKSTAMMAMMRTIRARGQRAIVYDKTGDFTAKFYRPGIDKLFNPFDARSVRWSPFADFKSDVDIINFATTVIAGSASSSADPMWIEGARGVMEALLHIAEGSMLRFVSMMDLSSADMCSLLEEHGFEAQIATEKTFDGMRVTFRTAARKLACLTKIDPAKPLFSIRKFIADEDHDSWLFINSSSEHQNTLRPSITACIDIATASIMRLVPNDRLPEGTKKRRMWMMIDELPTLQRLEALGSMLSECRKYGLCVVLGFQGIGQLKHLYGDQLGANHIGQLSTRLILRVQDADSADFFSRDIGEQKVKRLMKSTNSGDSSTSNHTGGGSTSSSSGSSQSEQITVERSVLPSTIQGMKDLEGYLKVPGGGIAKIKLDLVKMPDIAPDFVDVDAETEAHVEPVEDEAEA